MLRFTCLSFAFLIAFLANPHASNADEPKSLMGHIAEWQYPGSKINGAEMSDAATVNENGERTVPSFQCKTVLTTADPIAKVVDYYKAKLKPGADADKPKPKPKDEPANDSGRSITYHGDSENRPLAIHMILINTDHTSTTLVISRGDDESETHIAWTHYAKLPPTS